ncbi:hypothetical protein FRC12_016861 [Ceratobasidium sp. 428]|nr:hypothetical protein FRC12_016861 [Ceratobasidium sp. 428]
MSMSPNQIGGFFVNPSVTDCLGASRKYLFGLVGVCGETDNLVISATLILRSLEYKPVFEVAPNWEWYEYKKIDLDNPADKTFFEGVLAWNGTRMRLR